ncbi:MAG: hypothetical protein OXJ52_04045 [Oligoflexia bacterium]|nr:hypothetical protein [Oligoflexia bacterium]
MKKYLDISEVKAFQIDITSKCNLMCPQCSRVENGKLNPALPLTELSPEDYDIIFAQNCPSLEEIVLNGNYGDPIASKYIDHLIEKAENKNIRLEIFTNASLRTVDWWKNLGEKFKQMNSRVIFSIDGLKDTNSIYRINSNFDKIMENAQSYITSGGKARWDFLVFEHNCHQLETARELAKKLGFAEFQLKYTTRFLSQHLGSGADKDSQQVYNRKKKTQYEIKSAVSANVFDEILKTKYKNSYSDFLSKTPIDCKYKNWKLLFIDFSMRVYPCCWIGEFPYSSSSSRKKQFNQLTEKYETHFNSLRHHSLKEILDHKWFAHDLVESWSNKTNDTANPRWAKCSQICSIDYGFTNAPGSQNNILYQL